MAPLLSRHRRLPALLAVLALAAGSVFVAGGPIVAESARADTAPTYPADPTTPVTVSADALPAPQIDGVVWTQLVVGTTVYVGGQFTTARPAGAAPGVDTVRRSSLLAFDITTGALKSAFAPMSNGVIYSIVGAADGKHLYVAGTFSKIGSVVKSRIAEIDGTTGAVVGSFKVSVNNTVKALARRGNTLFFGGQFSIASGQPRQEIGALNATTGALTSWAPRASGGVVTSLALPPNGGKIVVGGAFTTLNGSSNPGYGLGAVDLATARTVPFHVDSIVRNGGKNSAITSLTATPTGLYGTGYTFGSGGNFEGTFRADWNAGDLTWIEDCHGDTYDSAVVGGVVYTAGHAHFCGNIGGFPETSPRTSHRAIAFTAAPTQTVATNQTFDKNYADFGGKPAPSLLNWYPDLTPGTFTGLDQAAWSVVATSDYVVYGGEFTAVNGTPQQGLVRFAVPALAPNLLGPVSSGANFVPSVSSDSPGQATVRWMSNADPDNATLTYEVLREGTVVSQLTADSSIWRRPELSFTDMGLVPGHSYAYRIRATDPFGNHVLGDNVSVTIQTPPSASAAPSAAAAASH